MSAPSSIRSTAGFRNLVLYELNTAGYPIGAKTLQAMNPYTITGGSVISGSTVPVAANTAVSGSIGYYGALASGGKVLTINDPTPRVIPHVGDDAIITLQVLPALEAASGEIRTDKTNDPVDAIIANVKKFTVGEMNLLGQITSQRGFESTVGALAYSFGQDTDPDSSGFGSTVWDFREFPKAIVFQRETGYGQEANERLYTFTPNFVTKHLWGTAFTIGVEGFIRGQIIRGVSQYKPVLVSYQGDGATKAFPFDSAKPAASATKMAVWKNGVLLSTEYTGFTGGIVFTAAPTANDVIVVFYETQ